MEEQDGRRRIQEGRTRKRLKEERTSIRRKERYKLEVVETAKRNVC